MNVLTWIRVYHINFGRCDAVCSAKDVGFVHCWAGKCGACCTDNFDRGTVHIEFTIISRPLEKSNYRFPVLFSQLHAKRALALGGRSEGTGMV